MNTSPHELTEDEIYAQEERADYYDRERSMKIIQANGNGSFTWLKNLVFGAVVLGMGAAIWVQKDTNAQFARQSDLDDLRKLNIEQAKEIAVLQIECRNNTQLRRPRGD